MAAAYIFSLVLGGGFLLVSVLGDVFGGDASDVALDGGLDVDVDVDVHADLDVGGADADVHAGHGAAGHGDAALVSKVFSFRMVVYTLFGFGAVGQLMVWAGSDPAAPLTVAAAVAGGLASGALVQSVFNYLRRTDSGEHVGEDAYVGLPAHVTLPLGGTAPGRIAVEIDARRVTLRALPHRDLPDEVVAGWTDVVIVDMERGVARVAPLDDDLKELAPGDVTEA